MGIEFIVNKKDEVILITATASISTADVKWMRNKTVELLEETGIKNYVVDLSKVASIVEQDTLTAYEVGKEFRNVNFPLSTKTAVILPIDESARDQVKFLHTVEINRMRGPLNYVSSYENALEWFNS